MINRKVSIGLDYGTESARALIADVLTGEEIATSTANFPTGVMDKTLLDGTVNSTIGTLMFIQD